MLPKLLVGKPALMDCFCGLVPCKVIKLTGRHGSNQSPNPTSAIDVEVEITKDFIRASGIPIYKKGERMVMSSLWVVPSKAIRRTQYNTYIGHYTVGM